MNKKRALIVLGISCTMIISRNVYGTVTGSNKMQTENSVIEEIYTYCADAEKEHTYPEIIIQGEKRYQLESVRYETEPICLKSCLISTPMWKESMYTPPPSQEIEGLNSELLYTETEEWMESGRTKYVSAEREVLHGDQIPESIEIETEDTITGEKYTVTILKTAVREDGAGWRKDVLEIPVVFENYGNEKGEYELNGKIVYLGTETPEFENYKQILLEQNGLHPDFNRITAITWDGEAYENESGITCRNAKTAGDQLVPRYCVTYEGEVFEPDLPMVRYINYYQSEATEYLITAYVKYQLTDTEYLIGQAGYMEFRILVVIVLQIIIGVLVLGALMAIRRCL